MPFEKPTKPVRPRKPICRGKGPRKKRKSPTAVLGREADRLWSLVVRKRGFCEICAKTERLQGAHGFSRRYRGTRWLPINGFCLDAGCHVRMTHDPLLWDQFLLEQWGFDTYWNLRAMAQGKATVTEESLTAIIESLKAELNTA